MNLWLSWAIQQIQLCTETLSAFFSFVLYQMDKMNGTLDIEDDEDIQLVRHTKEN